MDPVTLALSKKYTDANIVAGDGIPLSQKGAAGGVAEFDRVRDLAFNVQDYGATGDGATDDTAAIQAAIDAAEVAGGVVYAPAGVYMIDSLTIDASNVTLQGAGAGATILRAIARDWDALGDMGFIQPHGAAAAPLTNVFIYHLTVDGNRAAHTGDVSNRSKGEGIDPKHCRHSGIAYCDVINCSADGIDWDDSEDCFSAFNTLRDNNFWGQHISTGNARIRTVGCYAEGNGGAAAAGGQGGGFDTTTGIPGGSFSGCVSKDNYQNWNLVGDADGVLWVGNRSLGTVTQTDTVTGAVLSETNTPVVALEHRARVRFKEAAFFDAALYSARASANSTSLDFRQTGDGNPRWSMRVSGATYWGPGDAAADVALYRAGADELAIASGDTFRIAGGGWDTGHLRMGNYRLWVDAAGKLRIKSSAPTSDTDGTVVGDQTA